MISLQEMADAYMFIMRLYLFKKPVSQVPRLRWSLKAKYHYREMVWLPFQKSWFICGKLVQFQLSLKFQQGNSKPEESNIGSWFWSEQKRWCRHRHVWIYGLRRGQWGNQREGSKTRQCRASINECVFNFLFKMDEQYYILTMWCYRIIR